MVDILHKTTCEILFSVEGDYLQGANLRDVNLQGADLRDADLRDADLRDADLQYANLQYANLQGAILQGANLRDVNLRDADLQYANLQGANLQGANLQGAILQGAQLPLLSIVPEVGQFTGWKKLRGCLAEVIIPEDAGRVNSTGRKCRAEYVIVKKLYNFRGTLYDNCSQHNPETVYTEGSVVRPDSYNPDLREECTHGIHFFITRKEAEEY